jgi:hypothetical protein
MRDQLAHELETALEREQSNRLPDLAWVVARGRRLRMQRYTAVALSVVAVVAVVGTVIAVLPSPGSGQVSRRESPSHLRITARGLVIEHMSQQEQARVFAFRALAASGLMDPFGKRSYTYVDGAHNSRTDGGWRIGFAAIDCRPRQTSGHYVFTCRGLSGEDRLGNARTDTYVTANLKAGRWSVFAVQGNMPADERNRVVGYTLPQRSEPSHWEFPATGYWHGPGETGEAFALWVGPYPTSAPGSTCEIKGSDASGNAVGKPSRFYVGPPTRPFDVAGWIHGGGVMGPRRDVAQVKIDCHQVSRLDHWELASDPRLVGPPGQVMGVVAELVWIGNRSFASGALCTATLVDGSGKVVWRGSGRVEGQTGGTGPIHTPVLVSTRRQKIDAQAVGDFSCRS